MRRLSPTSLKVIRNIIVFGSMAISLFIWFYVPETFKNNALFHVGNGPVGTKIGALILVPLPLFALVNVKEKEEYHGTDEKWITDIESEQEKNNLQKQIVTAMLEAVVVIGLMLLLYATTL